MTTARTYNRLTTLSAAAGPRDDWRDDATCLTAIDGDLFFPLGTSGPNALQIAEAKEMCARCPVRGRCLDWAEERRIEFGIWGGMTEEERRNGRRKAARDARKAGA